MSDKPLTALNASEEPSESSQPSLCLAFQAEVREQGLSAADLAELEALLDTKSLDEAIISVCATNESLLSRYRRDSIGGDIFGDPAWDMMLLLAARYKSSHSVSMRELAFQCSGSYSAGLRWLKILTDLGYIDVTSADIYPLENTARLTDKGLGVVRECLKSQIANIISILTELRTLVA